MSPAFKLNDRGDIVGPSGTVMFPRETQTRHGTVELDVALLNQLYDLGQMAGKLSDDYAARVVSQHAEAAKNALEIEAEAKLCWKCFRPRHGFSVFFDGPPCDVNSLDNPNPPWAKP